MRYLIKALMIIMIMTIVVIAGENGRGPYVGLGYVKSSYNDGGYLKEAIQVDHLDGSDNGFLLYGGYQFNEVIGTEVSYTDYGTFTADENVVQAPTAFSMAINMGYSFLNGQLRPFITLGLAYIRTDYSNYPDTITIDERDYRVVEPDSGHAAFHYGAGIQYEPDFLIGFGVRLSYEANAYVLAMEQIADEHETDYYGQNLGAVYLGVQYKF